MVPDCSRCAIERECKKEKLEEKFEGQCPLLWALGFLYGRAVLREKLEEKGQKVLE